MEENQTINCTVKSCVYQDNNTQKCKLQSVQIMPKKSCSTKKADESMCGSYECDK